MLRGHYQQLSADPNSLANLDQDLPNNLQREVPIFSLPEDWLWVSVNRNPLLFVRRAYPNFSTSVKRGVSAENLGIPINVVHLRDLQAAKIA